jgi:hypothetical protein
VSPASKHAQSSDFSNAFIRLTIAQLTTLTTDLDNVVGGAGNDTILGDNASASLGDQVNGGAGTDTLKLFGNAAAPSLTNVEIVELTGNTLGFDVSGNADVTALNLINATTAQTYTTANGQNVSVATMVDGEAIDLAGNTVTALNLTVNGLGTAAGAGVDVDFNSTAQTTLNLTTATNASHIELFNTGAALTTVSVAGDQALTLDALSNNVTLTSVNGSTSTGALNLVLDDNAAGVVAVTGGTGNDTANFGDELTQTDKFDGGDGTDTLAVTQASVTAVQGLIAADKATLNANLANLEVLEVTDALTGDIDASRFDGINNFVLTGGLGNATAGADTYTLSKVASGVSVSLGDAAVQTGGDTTLAVAITDASLAGNNSDAVTLNLTDAAAGGSSDAGVVNLAGVDLLTINTTQATGGTTSDHVLDIANTSTALDKITVTGNTALDISAVALVDSIGEVDASGMTLASATATGLTVAIDTGGTNGVLITGSGGIDNLTGGDGADIIIGGAGADVLTGQADADKFVIASADTGVTTATADIIADFTTAADTLSVGTAGTVANFYELDTNTGATDQIATVELAVAAANAATGAGTSFDGTVQFMFVVDTASGSEGYLVADNDLNGVADFAVELTGLNTAAAVVFGDIVA